MSFGNKETPNQSFSCPSIDSMTFIGLIYASPVSFLAFSPNEGRGYVRIETSLHKQNHPFRDSSLSPLHHSRRGISLQPSHSPHPSSESGANSIHGFITVQITTIYLHANFCGWKGVWKWRDADREERRGKPHDGVAEEGERDGQPPCIREYFTLTALRGIGWPRPETLHRFGIMDLYITYSSWPMSC